MKVHRNTLYVTRPSAWIFKDGETVCVKVDGKVALRIPFLNLEGIVTMGWDILMSPQLMGACAKNNITVSFCDPNGRLLAASVGFTPGNVLLRREQYRRSDDEQASVKIARQMIMAKIANSRLVLMRAAREYKKDILRKPSQLLGHMAQQVLKLNKREDLLGAEGAAAEVYFSSFKECQTIVNEKLLFCQRSKRPPRDAINSLLSFCYTLLAHDARSALESCGLDAAVGFLHRDRPGRPSLALDLMEEYRPFLADRLALTLTNKRQITEKDFDYQSTGGVFLKEESRKKVITAWQERKQEIITHPLLEEKMTIGVLLFVQARLLARHLRGDLDTYPAYIGK